MRNKLLILSVLSLGVAQTSSAVEDTISNSTLTYTRANIASSYSDNSSQKIYSTSSDVHISNNEKISEALSVLKQQGSELGLSSKNLYSQKTNPKKNEDFEEIKKWAEQGNAKYQAKLARRYEDGAGVQQDHKKAVEWYKKSADQGYAISEFLLGMKYYTGEGVRHDYKKAFEWLRRAAKHEDEPRPEAEAILGLMYELGQGIRKNRISAKEWYGESCDNGYQDGCDQYRRLNLE